LYYFSPPFTKKHYPEKNTRPQVPSDESKKREKLNGLLAVDTVSGEEFLRLVPIAKTEDIALYFGELCKECIQAKIKHLTIILDNNSTHKDKLRRYLWAELFTSGIHEQITVEFVYTPPYSPNFNLVEYLRKPSTTPVKSTSHQSHAAKIMIYQSRLNKKQPINASN
jgi:hypothetical protein